MPINLNVVDKRKTHEFGVIRQIGDVTQEGEETTVSLTAPDVTPKEFANYDDSHVFYDKDHGMVSIKENLSIKRIMANLNKQRREGFHNLSLDEYLKGANYKNFKTGEPFTIKDIYRQMGFNPARDTVQFLLSTDKVTGSRELVPEIIRAFITKDLIEQGMWKSLVATERSISQPQEDAPHINYSGSSAQMEEIGEAEHVPLGEVSFGRKTVKITRTGVGIALTDPVKQYVTVDQLGIYLADVSTRLNNDLTSKAIDILLNGDKPNLTDPIGALGVDNVGNKIKYKDYIRAFLRYMRTAYRPTQIIANEAEALRQFLDADFSPSANNASARFQLNLGNTSVLSSATMWVHDDIANDKQLFLDPKAALEYLVSEPMHVEEERKASIETNAYYIRMTSGFANLIQAAKFLMDGTQTFASTGFPSYLALKK